MTRTWLALAVGFALFAGRAGADDPIPPDLIDPAFDRYVDLNLLRQALAEGDTALLTDCALQLGEGERVLLRPHKAVSADKVFRLAVRLANERGDQETLARLLQAAKASKKTDLVRVLEKAAGAPRRVDADGVSLDNVTAEQTVVYRSMADQVRAAKSVSSRARLDVLKKEIDKLDNSYAQLKTALLKQVDEARAALPAKVDREAAVLARLASSSRALPAAGPYYTVHITLVNPTPDAVGFSYEAPPGQPKPDPVAAEQTRGYSLQFASGKPATITPEKGEPVTLREGATYRIEKTERGYALKAVPRE